MLEMQISHQGNMKFNLPPCEKGGGGGGDDGGGVWKAVQEAAPIWIEIFMIHNHDVHKKKSHFHLQGLAGKASNTSIAWYFGRSLAAAAAASAATSSTCCFLVN